MVTTAKRKPLEYYLGLKYPVTLLSCPEGGYFIQVEDLPGCMSQGDTPEEAMEMIEEAKQQWLECMYEEGEEIPLPHNEDEYSGKFNVRLPKSLHQKLDKMARQEGVSLNQYLVATLSHAVGLSEGRVAEQRKAYRVSKKKG